MATIIKLGSKINLNYGGKLLLILNNNKAEGMLSIAYADKSLSNEIIDELIVAIIEHEL